MTVTFQRGEGARNRFWDKTRSGLCGNADSIISTRRLILRQEGTFEKFPPITVRTHFLAGAGVFHAGGGKSLGVICGLPPPRFYRAINPRNIINTPPLDLYRQLCLPSLWWMYSANSLSIRLNIWICPPPL